MATCPPPPAGGARMNVMARLVLNRGDGIAVLHTEDCPSIAHQVRQDERPAAQAGFTYVDLGPADGGGRLLHERRAESPSETYVAQFVDLEDLTGAGRYRRCRICAPDAPDGPPPAATTTKQARSLGASDIGRVSVLGRISAVLHEIDTTTVHFDGEPSAIFAADEALQFPKRVGGPVQGVDVGAS